MSANDVLDVLNIQRDQSGQPAKKKTKPSNDGPTQARQTGMARELYNLLGPNTPPVNLNSTSNNTGVKDKWKTKATPWTLKEFNPKSDGDSDKGITLYHWVRGAKELLDQEPHQSQQPYFFKKFNTNVDIPDLVNEDEYDKYMVEIKEHVKQEKRLERQRKKQLEKERLEKEKKEKERQERIEREKNKLKEKNDDKEKVKDRDIKKPDEKSPNTDKEEKKGEKENKKKDEEKEPAAKDDEIEGKDEDDSNDDEMEEDDIDDDTDNEEEWTYEETKYLFDLCKAFELKWHIIYDRYDYSTNRSQEDLKEHFYRICKYIYSNDINNNPALIESLDNFSKSKEIERKQYLEKLLKRTPAEIAEEESLVIEARRFELAAKKMLAERSNLLTLLDYPQTSQSVSQYQSSQGIANLYNNLMIMDKNQKRRQPQTSNPDPVPPTIPIAASSSIRKERSFQTHLQQYLTGLLKQNQNSNIKHETSAIQRLLMKRLSVKDEEAYGLHYHSGEKLTPGVILRSSQRLQGLQQRQSVLKSVNTILEELDISTAAGTSWKPIMPSRKTMAKYDELLKAVITLLDIKRGKDKLESEIQLIRSQKGLE